MSQHLYTFRKPEHLCLKTEIEALFGAGNTSMSAFPLRITYRKLSYTGQGPQVKVLLSVSKRHFKHAVDRNRAKRQIREAYRLQKHALLNAMPADIALHIAFIWLSDRPVPSSLVSSRMHTALKRIQEKVCPINYAEQATASTDEMATSIHEESTNSTPETLTPKE